MTKNTGKRPVTPKELRDEALDQASAAGDPIPTESISFNFDKITYTAPPAIKKR